MNKIIEAINAADEATRKEFLKPFGVDSFATLVTKFTDLETYKKSKVSEEEKETLKLQEEQLAESVFQNMKNAMVPNLASKEDPRVQACLLLSEEARPAFIKSLQPKMLGGGESRGVRASTTEGKELSTSAKKVLDEAFGHLQPKK